MGQRDGSVEEKRNPFIVLILTDYWQKKKKVGKVGTDIKGIVHLFTNYHYANVGSGDIIYST